MSNEESIEFDVNPTLLAINILPVRIANEKKTQRNGRYGVFIGHTRITFDICDIFRHANDN